MRVAAIDFGSNSFLCLIAELDEGGQFRELYDTIEFVKLGEGVHQNKAFSEAALLRADLAMEKFAEQIKKFKVQKIVSAATSAARDVKNRDKFFDLGKKHNIPIQIITGENEGDLTYTGVLSGRTGTEEFAVLDIGGGSTEIAFKKNGKIHSKSFNIGCVRLTELFLHSNPEKENEIKDFQNYLNKNMSEINNDGLEIVAVAGTPTTLASLSLEKEYSPELVDNFKLTKNQIDFLIQKLSGLTISERKKLKGIDAPRADVIMAGALILRHVLKLTGRDYVIVSTRGVRYGLAYKALHEGRS